MNIKYGNGIELEVVGLSLLYLCMSMGWRLLELLGNYWWRLASIMPRCISFLPSHLFRVAIISSSLFSVPWLTKTFTFAVWSHLNRYMTSRWIEKLSLPIPKLLINGKFNKKTVYYDFGGSFYWLSIPVRIYFAIQNNLVKVIFVYIFLSSYFRKKRKFYMFLLCV